jgi:hypothetical protein
VAAIFTTAVLGMTAVPQLFSIASARDPAADSGPNVDAEFLRKASKALGSVSVRNQTVNDPELRKLLRDRYECACRELESHIKRYCVGSNETSAESFVDFLKRFVVSDAALSDRPDDQIAAWERAAELAKVVEETARMRYEAGRLSIQNLEVFKYHRLDMQIKLLETRQKYHTKDERDKK